MKYFALLFALFCTFCTKNQTGIMVNIYCDSDLSLDRIDFSIFSLKDAQGFSRILYPQTPYFPADFPTFPVFPIKILILQGNEGYNSIQISLSAWWNGDNRLTDLREVTFIKNEIIEQDFYFLRPEDNEDAGDVKDADGLEEPDSGPDATDASDVDPSESECDKDESKCLNRKYIQYCEESESPEIYRWGNYVYCGSGKECQTNAGEATCECPQICETDDLQCVSSVSSLVQTCVQHSEKCAAWEEYYSCNSRYTNLPLFCCPGSDICCGGIHNIRTSESSNLYSSIGTLFPDGKFAIIGSTVQGSSGHLNGQVFDSTGAYLDPQFRVNQETILSMMPNYDMKSLGESRFVIAWNQCLPPEGMTFCTETNQIRARLLKLDNANHIGPIGGEIIVNQFTTISVNLVQIITFDTNTFAIFWKESPLGPCSLLFQKYDSNGAKSSETDMPIAIFTGYPDDFRVLPLDNTQFVVTLVDNNQIQTLLFNSDATLIYSFAVYSRKPVQPDDFQITPVHLGFMVIWRSEIQGPSNSRYQLEYQRYSYANRPMNSAGVLIDNSNYSQYSDFNIEALSSGKIVVTWNELNGGAFGQFLNSEGIPLGKGFNLASNWSAINSKLLGLKDEVFLFFSGDWGSFYNFK